MALIKGYTLKNGLEAPNAYHIIHKIDTFKRAVDDKDPAGARPSNSPEFLWKAGYYAKMAVSIYASKEARESGKTPIAVLAAYPTDAPGLFQGEITIEPLVNFGVDINSPKSVVEQGYDHLLTLTSYYDGAVND
jgi:hypothetical protein